MLSVSYAGKNKYGAGKTSGVLRVGASGANRGYVLAHCRGWAKKFLHNHLREIEIFTDLLRTNQTVENSNFPVQP